MKRKIFQTYYLKSVKYTNLVTDVNGTNIAMQKKSEKQAYFLW